MIGKQLNHYEIIEKLGSGGMGEVWVARDTTLDRRVALKVLPAELAGDPERLERFEREAKVVAALNHPNIVTIYTVEEADGLRFMTMELIEGRTLDEEIPPEGMALERFFELAIPLADALHAAHRANIQHRDLKPANVMVNDAGRIKVLDFGLAKLHGDEGAGPDGMTQMMTGELTGAGQILGTVSYMSPEQAQGGALDHRSDIFSLGILLYEMLTGVRPFAGDNNISVLSAILKDEPSSVSDLRQVPVPVARVIERALAKSRDQRYQSVSDLRQDLENVRDDVHTGEILASGAHAPLPTASNRRAPMVVAASAVLAMAGFFGWRALAPSDDATGLSGGLAVPAADTTPGVAVFYFDNISGDEELDWLRQGLTDMLVTDLSQSASVRVLSTDRLYTLLSELGYIDDETTSSRMIEAVAREALVDTAVLGSFVRAGESIRISARVQDIATGEVLSSERVEGQGEESIFGLVDDLTTRIRANLDVDDSVPSGDATLDEFYADRDLQDVSTSSLDAYRAYAAGITLHEQSREADAIPFLEEAVELDPDFAMAHAKLSVAHGNEGNVEEARHYAERAMELAERLPARERFYIEGRFKSLDPETVPEAIEAYGRAVERYPDHSSARNNLAQLLMQLDRTEEAIRHFEELRRRRMTFAGTYGSLAGAYADAGRVDEALQVLREYVDRHPDNASGRQNLATYLGLTGDVEGALDQLAAVDRLDRNLDTHGQRARLLRAAGRIEAAMAEEEALLASDRVTLWASGYRARVERQLQTGRLLDARETIQEALRRLDTGNPVRGQVLSFWIDLESNQREGERMLAAVEEMASTDDSFGARQQVHVGRAVAYALIGDQAAARASRDAFFELVADTEIPERLRRRIEHQIDGSMAWARGDWEMVASELTPALELSVRRTQDQRLGVAYALGEALWELGRYDEAAGAFAEVTGAPFSLYQLPVLHIRGIYYEGRVAEARGDLDTAREKYRRFIEYWGEGDIDPERVADARARLAPAG